MPLKNCQHLPVIDPAFIAGQDYFLLFQTLRLDEDNFTSYIFASPLDVIKITDYKDVKRAFGLIERCSRRHYLAGYFSYELGYYFEGLQPPKRDSSPRQKDGGAQNDRTLIHLAVFDKAASFDHRTGRFNNIPGGIFSESAKKNGYSIKNLRLSFNESEYASKIRRLKEYIKNGDTYQVNFTGRYLFDFGGCAWSLYKDLAERQNTPYAAFCKFKDEYVLSLSPELFFKRDGRLIHSRPMKGTAKRGKDAREDSRLAAQLKDSAKNRAENLMIVDLMRNDLGRISQTGSVNVPALFDVEKYGTLFQMTSTVKARLRSGVTYFDIFKAVFPGGSVTGAPKISTMRIIKSLEGSPRGIYCGALGIIFPGNKAVFNMPIRTVQIRKNSGQMGVGSGIVWDSRPRAEYNECALKARFLSQRRADFRLLETILWDSDFKFLPEHLLRMQASARYFGFAFEKCRITALLKEQENGFDKRRRYRVRLLLGADGAPAAENSIIQPDSPRRKRLAAISKQRVDPCDVFCYHKTTNRAFYDAEYRACRKKGYYDVIFLNKYGEVTEGAVSNVVIRKGPSLYTPPVRCGLLPGIFRGDLLKNSRVKEKVLHLEDLQKADRIFLCNSVRGLNEAALAI